MKTRIIFYLLLAFFIAACSKDENPEPEKSNAPPEVFALVEVADNATAVALMPTFNWQAATDPDGDAVTYDIYMGTETDPAKELAAGLSKTSYTATDRLHLSTPYHWKVVAKDDKNNQTESAATFTFTTRNISKGEEATPNAGFSVRSGHSSVIFDNKIWVIGGFDGSFKNDVWYSTDGINWTKTTPDTGAIFSGRYGHSSVVFDNKIWVLSGQDATGLLKKDVWYSTDGTNWEEVTADANFSERFGHSSVVHDGKMWVLGGSDGSFKNDVWYSSDGIIWTAAPVPDAGFPARRYHSSVVYDNKIWVMGGNDVAFKNDIWYSSDGTNWTRATPDAGADFSARSGHASMVYDDKLWIIGGYDGTNYKNDIWYSTNGTTWEEAASNADFQERFGHSSLVYKDKIWLMGGRSYNQNYFNDVWYLD